MITRRQRENSEKEKGEFEVTQQSCDVGVPRSTELDGESKENSSETKNHLTEQLKIQKDNFPTNARHIKGTLPVRQLRVLQCARCGFCSNDEETLAKHISLIHGVDVTESESDPTKPLQCTECDYSSTSKHCLKQHYDLVHVADRPFKCPFCNYAGKRSHSLKEHLVVHSSTPPYKCSVCNASFRKKGHLTNHVRLHAKKIECKFCNVKLNTREEMEEHVASEHVTDDIYICEYCSFSTGEKLVIDKHMESHGCLPMYGCDDCSFQSENGDKLKEHLEETKHGSRQNQPVDVTVLLKCAECGLTTQDKHWLKMHMIEQHSDKDSSHRNAAGDAQKTSTDETYKCSECSFTCSKAYPFITHILSHKAKVPVKSPQVSKTALQANAPRPDPNFTHDASIGLYRCNICGYLSEHQRSIKTHIWKHSGHKDIDYPMFQNGPLSVYDITPIGETVLLDNPEQQVKVVSMETKMNMTLANTKNESVPFVSEMEGKSEVPVIIESEDKLHDDVPQTLLANGKVRHVLQCAWCDFVVSDVPSLEKHLESAHKIKEKIYLPEDIDLSGDSTNDAFEATEEMEVPEDVQQINHVISGEAVCKKTTGQFEESISDPAEEPTTVMSEDETYGNQDEQTDSDNDLKKVVVFQKESADVVNEIEVACQDAVVVHCSEVDHLDINLVPMTVEEVSDSSGDRKRKPDDLELNDSKRLCREQDAICTSESVVVQQMPQVYSISYQDQGSASPRVSSPRLSRASSRESLTEDHPSEPSSAGKPRQRCQSATSQEFVNLLSLLKKGPNYNPACPSSSLKRASTDSEKPSEGSDVEDSSSRPGKKTGICSSLLAVIEQLRERSKSESDGEGSQDNASLSSGGGKRRRVIRRGSLENADLENLQNVEHIKEEDGELKSTYRCKLCHYTNSSPALIKTHMRLHKTKQPSECSLCDYVAESSEQLQDHMLQHCKVRIYQCKLCPSKFHYKSQLRAHMRAHDRGQYTCKYCSFETTSTMSYRSHLMSHAQYSGDSEQIDSDSEIPTGQAKSPPQTENLSPIFKCLKCDKTFVDKEELLGHTHDDQPLQVQPNNSRKAMLKCAACSFNTSDLEIMKQHAASHQDYPLKCDMCDFEALSTRSLKSHMKRHANDQRFVQQPLEQYKCNLCGYVCHHLPSLKSHMWRHASDTNYSYQKTNDIINAAIDYDITLPSNVATESRRISVEESVATITETPSAPGSENCFVTFRCCQCGFESTNKGELHTHMKEHMDIIQKTMEITPYPPQEDSTSQT